MGVSSPSGQEFRTQPRPEWHLRFSQNWRESSEAVTTPSIPVFLCLNRAIVVKNTCYVLDPLDKNSSLENSTPDSGRCTYSGAKPTVLPATWISHTATDLLKICTTENKPNPNPTRRPAYADRTARRQFQATCQPVSRTQASNAMTSRLPRYKVKCVQHRCFQCGSVPLCSDIKERSYPLPIYW